MIVLSYLINNIRRIVMKSSLENEIEAASLKRLLSHLDERKDVQNIDLMNLAGFCRNCLSRWYREESIKLNLDISDKEAREKIYGMPYDEWKQKYQKEASQDQKDKFKKNHNH